MFEREILKLLKTAGVHATEDVLETSPKDEFGDLSFPCFNLAKERKMNPAEIAKDIASKIKIPGNYNIEKVEVVGAYVNFFYNYSKLSKLVLTDVLKKKAEFGKSGNRKGKILVEFAHPNTHKLFHIGHLRNITTGESLSRIMEFNGFDVIRANYQGDVGLHIAKCLWGIKKTGIKKFASLGEKITFLGKAYATGSKAFEEDATAKNEIVELNKQIYKGDRTVLKLWKETRKWSLDYFDGIYKRVNTRFDRLYFESEVAAKGLAIAKKALKKGILTKSEGAIIFDGEKHGLDKRVFINQIGFPTYEAKELGLAELEFSEFGNIRKAIHVVGPEQSSFFKVMFKVEELLNPKKFKGKQQHLAYGWVRLKEGKMSSRLGNVVEGEHLLNELKRIVLENYLNKQDYPSGKKMRIAEKIAVGAAKYFFLRFDIPSEISFDLSQAASIEGNTGPYIQYAYTRCASIVRKAGKWKPNHGNDEMELEEKRIVKLLSGFPRIASQAADDMKPNYICNYVYELATALNNFYEKHRVIDVKNINLRNFRLTLIKSAQTVLGNCLELLGIETVERM
ncbi:MAG: arginine--tRNA ligase [Candidatus Aenigmarchaeota archaeon]|nr:arginine--tRNA ligase [Candidatus Aenigmarchaeota archaeon]